MISCTLWSSSVYISSATALACSEYSAKLMPFLDGPSEGPNGAGVPACSTCVSSDWTVWAVKSNRNEHCIKHHDLVAKSVLCQPPFSLQLLVLALQLPSALL